MKNSKYNSQASVLGTLREEPLLVENKTAYLLKLNGFASMYHFLPILVSQRSRFNSIKNLKRGALLEATGRLIYNEEYNALALSIDKRGGELIIIQK